MNLAWKNNYYNIHIMKMGTPYYYKLNRNFRKLSIISILIICSVISLLFINKSNTEMIVLGSPFHYSDISKYTSLFSTILKPKCANFTEYYMDSKPYWQYYGFPHNLKLTEDSLSNFLKISSKQENEITRLHDELLNKYLSPKYKLFSNLQSTINKFDKPDNKGIVYVSGKSYYWLTMLSIKYIRDVLNDKQTPIEIFVPFKQKNDYHCNKISLVFPNIKCSYFSDYLSTNQIKQLSGYQYKSLALLLTKFNDILYLDSDNIPLVSVQEMFNNPTYLKTGFISWPDFWKRSTNFKFYKMSSLSGFAKPISTTPSVESGQILINKQTHLKTLLLAYYYNYYGPGYFYPLFSQGFPGQGDKESFYLASRVTNEKSFLLTGYKTKSFGYRDKNGSYKGQGILQADPSNVNDYWFLHMNYPKLNINEMLKENFFKTEKSRHWMIVKNAQDDSTSKDFKNTVGDDLEFQIWKIMDELLAKDFKGFQVFNEIGNDEMADYVRAHIINLENSRMDR